MRKPFDQFVSYVKRGDRALGPEFDTFGKKFNWLDKNEVGRMVTKMAGLTKPTDPSMLYMSGTVEVQQVMPEKSSITALYNKIQEFDKLVTDEIARMPDGDAKNRARTMHDVSSTRILPAATELRKATRDALIFKELSAKFSPTGKYDKVYEYTGPDGKPLRFDPIQWVTDEVTLWGRKYKQYNEGKTAEKSPQLRNPELYKRVTEHIQLWENDGSNGKGQGLLFYKPLQSGSNRSHAHVIKLQETTYAKFRGNTQTRC